MKKGNYEYSTTNIICLLLSQIIESCYGAPRARTICTRTDINISLATSHDVVMLHVHVPELNRYNNPRIASRSILVVLQRQDGDMLLPSLTPSGI